MKTFLLAMAMSTTMIPISAAIAQACSKQSPAHTVALLELYTSEGCSSCPPADKFVSGLRAAGLTTEQVVPLALHVDYWDYIGWKDVFASREFTERQRWLSALAASRTVYTPEIFVAGRELRGWGSGTAAAVRRVNERPAQAHIGVTLGKMLNGALPVEVSAKSAQAGQLFVALYENGLASHVRAGENQGELLQHDYVVREWIGPVALTNGAVMLSRSVPVRAGLVVKNLGVAAFVQGEKGEVLQAVALPVCGG